MFEEEERTEYYCYHYHLISLHSRSAYISCEAQFSDAVQLFMEQVDIIKQLVAKYPNDLKWAVSSDDIGQTSQNVTPHQF